MKLKKIFLSSAVFVFTALSACSIQSSVISKKTSDSLNSPDYKTRDRALRTSSYDYSKAVLLISFDGFRPDYLSKNHTPNLYALSKRSLYAPNGMTASFPSLTFPNHYSIVTGLRPVHHGIVANEFKDPEIPNRFKLGAREITNDPRWWLGEPIWVSAHKQGLKSGTVFWPGSEAEIRGIRPTYYLPYNKNMSRTDRVRQFLSWLDLPEDERPNFFTLYFEDVDSAGHKFGPDSQKVISAARDLDDAIGLLISELKSRNLWDRMNLLIVADHGMTNVEATKRVSLFSILNEYPDIESIGGGAMLGIFASDPAIKDDLIKKINSLSPLIKAYKKEKLPKRFHYSESARIPDIVVLAKESAFVSSKETPYTMAGAHGYDPNLKSMQAFFMAHGPAFKTPATVPNFDNIDIYSLLCKVLGIEPAANDGSLKTLGKFLK